jgi:DNA polymerase I-like protein with 3'-5' exonuclease and polymerase domains
MNIDTSEAVRKLIVPRISNGVMIEVDYGQLEVVTLAILSGDEAMKADLRNDVDFHCKRATFLNPALTYEECFHRAKMLHDPEVVALRKLAKQVSFQRQYGAGPTAIAASTGMSLTDVTSIIEKERAMYPETEALFEHHIRQLKLPTAKHAAGRIIQLPSGQELLVPMLQLQPSPTATRNFPVQGFAAQIVQTMLGKVYRALLSETSFGREVFLVNTVHDCVWVEASQRQALAVGQLVRRVMESAPQVIDELWPELDAQVSLPVSLESGPSLGELRDVSSPN